MTIRNDNLGGADYTASTAIVNTDFNDTFDAEVIKDADKALISVGLNSISQMIDRDVPVSAGKIDSFIEAYIDADGRKDTVDAGSTDATFDTDKYTVTGTATSYIKHTIPSELFISSVNAVIGVPFYEDFETGASITYKLYNSTTDTGYISTNEIHEITAFTEMPRFIMVKLIPSTSPTSAYPSINGFYVWGSNI